MFIRTKDNTKITDNNYQNFHFLNSNRKGNIALKFEIIKNDVRFFADELEIKMIPKDKTSVLEKKDIKIISTEDGNSLVYQDFEENPIKFLSLNEETDEIEDLEFYEIIPEQTEILCFDSGTEGYYFSKVSYTSVLIGETVVEGVELEQKVESSIVFKNELDTLSRYIIGTSPKEGIVLNNIMIV